MHRPIQSLSITDTAAPLPNPSGGLGKSSSTQPRAQGGVTMIDPDLHKVDDLIRHSRRCGCPDEAQACLAIAETMLIDFSNVTRREHIVARASVAHAQADLLEKFRGLLSFGEAHGGLSPAGERLLAIARQAPQRPKASLSAEGTRFFAFHTQNSQEISDLIEQL